MLLGSYIITRFIVNYIIIIIIIIGSIVIIMGAAGKIQRICSVLFVFSFVLMFLFLLFDVLCLGVFDKYWGFVCHAEVLTGVWVKYSPVSVTQKQTRTTHKRENLGVNNHEPCHENDTLRSSSVHHRGAQLLIVQSLYY